MPELEHQQLPQPQRVIAPAGQVLVDEPVDERRFEVAALPRSRRLAARPRRARVSPPRNHTPSGTPKPCFFRSSDAGAAAATGRDALQDVLAPAVRILKRGGQRRGEIDDRGCRAAARAIRSSAPCSCGPPSSARLRADTFRNRTASSGCACGSASNRSNRAAERSLRARTRRSDRRSVCASTARARSSA